MYTREEVAKTIDHAVLKPTVTEEDLKTHAQMCIKNKVKSICVRPCDIARVSELLKGSGVDVGTAIGFPHGSNCTEVKALEAELSIKDGAKELDMVMNIGKFLSGDHDYVKKDIEAVVEKAKPENVLVKVILETCFLNIEQVRQACKIAEEAGADFVKTSTGFADGGAVPEVIDVMIKTVHNTMGIKASGGIRSWKDAVGYLEQGCKRLGIGSTEEVLNGAETEGEY